MHKMFISCATVYIRSAPAIFLAAVINLAFYTINDLKAIFKFYHFVFIVFILAFIAPKMCQPVLAILL